jgi:hypothetical protein
LGVALVFAGGQQVQADKASAGFKKSLSSVPAPEIPETAATLVAQSKAELREATAQSVVEAALELSPATAPELAGSIARKNPAMAPAVAATAAAKQPQVAALIAKAAAVSAPKYAGQIVAAISKKQPSLCAKVALEVVRAVPHAGPGVITALLDAIPNLKPFIDKGTAMAGSNGSADPSALLVLSYSFAVLDKTASVKGVSTPQLLAESDPIAQLPGSPAPLFSSNPTSVPEVIDPSTSDPRAPKSPPPPGHRQDHNYSRP